MNEVSILIPSRFDSKIMLDLCLRSIRKYTEHPYRIIVGDAGVDEEASEFLKQQSDVTVSRCPDPLAPKHHLARIVETPYLMFLHDDAQIMRPGWLKRRVDILERDPALGFVGPLGFNFGMKPGWRQYLSPSPLVRRFFPFSLVVRKEAQENLDLFWGKIAGFDYGTIAYLQYKTRLITGGNRKKWEFRKYDHEPDVKHWKEMTWPLRKADSPETEARLQRREAKLEQMRRILETESY